MGRTARLRTGPDARWVIWGWFEPPWSRPRSPVGAIQVAPLGTDGDAPERRSPSRSSQAAEQARHGPVREGKVEDEPALGRA